MCNTKFIGNLFVKLGIRQEHFIEEEMHIKRMVLNGDKCPPDCRKCEDYCPLGLDVPAASFGHDDSSCIECLYCYAVCPKEGIQLEGTFGFLEAQMDKYDLLIRRVA